MMPLFEFACINCGREFEKLVRVSALDEVICPYCASPQVKRHLSRIAVSGGNAQGSVNSGADCAPGGT